MKWIEVKIKTSPDAVEIISGYLMTNGVLNVRIVDDESMDKFLSENSTNWDYKSDEMKLTEGAEVIFYVQIEEEHTLKNLEEGVKNLAKEISEVNFGDLKFTYTPVDDEDWLNEWKKTYKPFKIGDGVIVCPYWENYKPAKGETVFTIDPGAVFGTGLHATTQLCITKLEKLDMQNARVLDIGCGSGILSVISLLLGASSAMACDIDPSAARCAMENVRLNNINPAKYDARTFDIFEEELEERFDIVLANIVADVIIGLSPKMPGLLTKKGVLIASGIIDDRVEEVKAALNENGIDIIEEKELDGWYCVVGVNKNA